MNNEAQMGGLGLECPGEGLATVTGDQRKPQASMTGGGQ